MKNIISLPGWGFSANSLKRLWPDSISLTCEDLFRDESVSPLSTLNKVVKSFGEVPYTMIGWSMGALLALDYLSSHTDSQADLILISPTASFKYKNEINFKELEELIQNLSADRSKTLNKFYLNLISPSKLNRVDTYNRINKFREESEKFSTNPLINGLNYLKTKNIEGQIQNLKNSCLIIHGEKDNLIPQSHSELIHKILPKSILKIIPNASHMLPYDHETEILNFINQYDFSRS